jgi:hypothetical protein
MKLNMAAVVTIAALLIGVALFVATDGFGKQQRNSGEIYKDIQIKTSYLDGNVKLFALVEPEQLEAYAVAEGTTIPTDTSMVLGSAEAQMMKNEKLITGVGSSFDDFFGITTTVGGILVNTSTSLDDMHFLSATQYAAINGEEGRVFVVRSPEGMGKLFYKKGIDEEIPLSLELAEGTMDNYQMQTVNGKQYNPILVGFQEAQMMRSEKLFTVPGDTIDGFFGQNVYVAGILAENKTALDMMHVTPFVQGELR